jgi:signal transduction histidine kinase/CheY-like chemotaxis protein
MSADTASAFREPEIGEAELRQALEVIVRDSLRPVTGGLVVVYAVVAVAHALFLPREATFVLSVGAAVLIGALLAGWLFLRRVTVPASLGNPIVALIIVALEIFSLVRLIAVPEIPNALSQPLLVVGAACFLLSRNWLLFVVFAVNGGWILTAWWIKADVPWRQDLTPLLGGAMLAILIHAVRYRFLMQMEMIRLKDEVIRKELEVAKAAADEAREASESANRAKTSFLARMSHELRTPLNAIIGYSEMLQEEAEDLRQEGFTEDLYKIRSAGKHLLDLINEVLDLSKIEAGRMDLYLETFQVRNLVEDAIHTVEPQLEKGGNTLELHFDNEIKAMHADITKVRQCLINLLSNAAKFTEKGAIELRVRYEKKGGKEWIIFEVQDSGIGIAPEHIDRIFEPFSQADPSTTRKYGGTGLGLVISQKFCRMMSGSIEVESREGEGSTFRMRLPAEVSLATGGTTSRQFASAATSSSKRRRRRELVAPKGTILVIDDDPAVQELVDWNLNRQGFHVEGCPDGESGLQMAKRLEPSAILLDVKLPGIDGWEVLRRIKADAELEAIPVIVVSILDERAKSFDLGAEGFLPKPIEREHLISTIEKVHRPH